MASLRSSAFQSLIRVRSPLLRCHQRRWAQVHDVRFLATHNDPAHVLEKYRSKLDQKAKTEGHESVESLKDAYKDKIHDLRRKAETPLTPEVDADAGSESQSQSQSSSPPPPPSQQAQKITSATSDASSSDTGIKPLSSYLDVEKIASLPPKEIEALWRLRHANSDNSIVACIPLDTYARIANAARENPQFVLPLPRTKTEEPENENADSATTSAAGADVHFLQWAFHPPATSPTTTSPSSHSNPTKNTHTSTLLFTNLESYKLHGTFATPHTVITHHLDLADAKGLVLMHGQVTPNSGVTTTEASWLVSCVQRFYDFGGQAQGRKGELVRMFTRGDVGGFKIEEVMEEAERF